jgi:hypothetical protein
MIAGALARAALRCYPPATRIARGAEMLDTLLEASDGRRGALVWNVGSLVAAGLSERARASARVGAVRTIADAAKLASILYACLWLTAILALLIDQPGWRHGGGVWFYTVALVILLLAWWQGRQRLAGMIGLACTVLVALLVARQPDVLPPASIVAPIVPAFGYLIMAIAPERTRPSTVAVAALAALIVVSVLAPGANTRGFGSQFIVLATASIAGLAVFAVQPRLAIAVAIIWTAIGIELIALATPQASSWKLLVGTAPAVLAATVGRAQLISRGAT